MSMRFHQKHGPGDDVCLLRHEEVANCACLGSLTGSVFSSVPVNKLQTNRFIFRVDSGGRYTGVS